MNNYRRKPYSKSMKSQESQRQYSLTIGLVVFVSCIFSQKFMDPINWPKQIAIVTVLPALFYLALKSALLRSFNFRRLLYLHLFAIFLLLPPVLINSENWTRSLWGLWGRNNGVVTQISLILICFCFSILSTNLRSGLPFLRGLSYFFSLSILYGYIQYFNLDPFNWSQKNQVFSFFGNTNFAAAIFSISATSTFALLVVESRKKLKLLHGFYLCATIFIIVQTKSLQGILSFGLGLGIFLFAMWRSKRVTDKVIVFSILAISSIPIIFGLFGKGPLSSLYQYTLLLRSYYWKAGLEIGLNSPILGVGVDSYGDSFRSVRELQAIRMTTIDLTTNNAHNTFIQFFSTLGLFGLLSLLVIFLPGAFVAAKNIFSSGRSIESKTQSALFLQYLLISMISIDNIAVAIVGYSILGTLVSQFFVRNEVAASSSQRSIRPISLSNSSYFKLITLYLLTPLCFSFAWIGSFTDRQLAGIFMTTVTDNSSASIRGERLVNVYKQSPFIQEQEYQFIAEGLQSLKQDTKALEVVRAALKSFPSDFNLLDRGAVLAENLGSYEEAIIFRERQTLLDPNHPMIRLYLARDYFEVGRNSDAIAILKVTESQTEFMTDSGKRYRDALIKQFVE